MTVALFDTSTPLQPLRQELRAAVERVLDSGVYILGPEVQAFERELAAFVGADHAIGVANGTDALTIALRAMGVGPGDEVVVPSFTFYASAEAIPPTGAVPVFCDVDPQSFCVTPETVRAALSPRTRAVVVVHLFGNVAPVREIESLGVPVLEDAAQAAGASSRDGRTGALGTAATFSFFPSKNLGCFGDGGAITTSDTRVAERARSLRFHGSRDKLTFEQIGCNSRLDALQAAVLRVQLPHLGGWARRRREVAEAYGQAGLGDHVTLPASAPGTEPAWHLFTVRTPEPDALARGLGKRGIEARSYYRKAVHEQPAMRPHAPSRELPGTAEASRTNLALPMAPTLGDLQVREVVDAVRAEIGAVGAVAAAERSTA